jgi:2-succinyl-6-hydroxy-2,4-cyclohexadiene-1-carboxylate synthase
MSRQAKSHDGPVADTHAAGEDMDGADRDQVATIDRIDTPAGALAVRRFGGGAPGLVALHGFALHGGQFAPLCREGGWRVDAPDLPGHGLTTVDPVRLDTTIDALSRWLSGAGRPPVLGYSQGGRVALHLAWRRPDLVGSLVVVSAGPGLDADARAARASVDAEVADRIERDGVAAYVDGWLDHPVFGTARLDPVIRIADRVLRLENRPAGLAAARRGLGQGALPRVPLESLRMPVLWVAGELDRGYTAVMSAAAATRGDPFVVVPGVGHNVVAEAPGILARSIDEWMVTRG